MSLHQDDWGMLVRQWTIDVVMMYSALIAPEGFDPEEILEPYQYWVGMIRDVRARGPQDVSSHLFSQPSQGADSKLVSL